MQRVTTPTHEFILDINPREWDEFRITYVQNRKIIVEKTESDLPGMLIEEIAGDTTKYRISYQLTQEETRAFSEAQTKVQIRAHYPNGTTIASQIFVCDVADVLNHEILGSGG